jgi:enoyl-CoA hydratase/carnithine racemase
LLDVPAVVVDLRTDADLDAPPALRQLACPVIALVGKGATTTWPVDLVLEEGSDDARLLADDVDDAAAALVAAAQRAPAAAAVLVQALRATGDLPIADALAVESLAYSLLLTGPDFRRWLDARPLPRPASDTENAVVVRRDRGVREVNQNRPSVRNAYDAPMRDALHEGLSLATLDPSVERVVLRGNGPSFCSGGDLRDFGSSDDLVQAHRIRVARHPAVQLSALSARTEVHVHGACVGAGVELPAFAGTVTARSDATFRLPELSMGTVPGAGGTVSLPRRIGRGRALLLALSGLELSSSDALRWGLVDQVVAELPESGISA